MATGSNGTGVGNGKAGKGKPSAAKGRAGKKRGPFTSTNYVNDAPF